MSNYATKKKSKDATGVTTSKLAVKSDLIPLKAEVDKLDINKVVSFPASLNNLKTKVDDLDVGKLKTVPTELKNLSDVLNKEVVKEKQNSTHCI